MEEEFIVNKLMKRLDQLKKEKQVLANEVSVHIAPAVCSSQSSAVCLLRMLAAVIGVVIPGYPQQACFMMIPYIGQDMRHGNGAGRARGGVLGEQLAKATCQGEGLSLGLRDTRTHRMSY